MKPLRTRVRHNVMTYGWWDRLLRSLEIKLNNYVETRHERLWEEGNRRDRLEQNKRDEGMAPRHP